MSAANMPEFWDQQAEAALEAVRNLPAHQRRFYEVERIRKELVPAMRAVASNMRQVAR